MRKLFRYLAIMVAAAALAGPAFAFECAATFSYDADRQRFICADGKDGSYCFARDQMVMMLACDENETKIPPSKYRPVPQKRSEQLVPFRFLSFFFPSSNARLDENFSAYIEFIIETIKSSALGLRGGQMIKGGIVIDQKDHPVTVLISAPKAPKSNQQTWMIYITGYGDVEMKMILNSPYIYVKYKRTMEEGSYTESMFYYPADAKCPRPVILDPSHTPKE